MGATVRVCVLIALLIVGLGCPAPSTAITVVNRSQEGLRNVTLTGRGFDQTLPLLKAGESIQVAVHPAGESGLSVGFTTAKGHRLQYPEQDYLEPGYLVTVVIDSDLRVQIDSTPPSPSGRQAQ